MKLRKGFFLIYLSPKLAVFIVVICVSFFIATIVVYLVLMLSNNIHTIVYKVRKLQQFSTNVHLSDQNLLSSFGGIIETSTPTYLSVWHYRYRMKNCFLDLSQMTEQTFELIACYTMKEMTIFETPERRHSHIIKNHREVENDVCYFIRNHGNSVPL